MARLQYFLSFAKKENIGEKKEPITGQTPAAHIGTIWMKFVFTATEVKEILISAIILSVAFAFAYSDGLSGAFSSGLSNFYTLIIYAFIAVGIGFLAHELIGHKIIAQHIGMHGEYRLWRTGLLIALGSSVFGFVFAAPGAVYVSPKYDIWGRANSVSRKQMGLVSVMGPVVNLALAAAFMLLNSIAPSELFRLAVFVNVWLGVFNMIPIPPLDGSKVFAWDRRIWAGMIVVLIAAFFFVN